jgi:tRNA(Ile)-lysidine synthase
MARALDRPFLTERADVAALASAEHRSIEDAGRHARYAFFERARVEAAADVVALGHTRDDQAETFLLRLLRGAGARGLAGMHPRRDAIIRPLLDCRRADLRAFLLERHIAYVHDETNDDVSIPRNRVRAELLPLLERFNPSIVDVLASDADVAREEWRWMDAMAGELAARIARPADSEWRIDAAALAAAPTALARLVVQRTLCALAGGRAVSVAHIDEVLRLCGEGGATAADLPGQRVERVGPDVVLRSSPVGARGSKGSRNLTNRPNPADGPNRANGSNRTNAANLFWYPLSIPGEVQLFESGCLVSAEEAQAAPGGALGSGAMAVVQLDRRHGPLAVRNRRPGDKFRPLGL